MDIILANVAAIDYPNVEILISDRHQLDDAAEVLARELAADRRVRVIRAHDALSWVEHFNFLLREARGVYSTWMPHDDSYPPGYLSQLVAALEARPDAVLAFGRVEQISLDGYLPTLPFTPPPIDQDRSWSLTSALRMLTLWQLWFAFRGVVRRDVVTSNGLYLRSTYRNIRADIYWVFGLALRGRLLYVPSVSCTKRFYRASGGADWRFDRRQSLDACRVLASYLDDFAAGRPDALVGRVVLWPWCLVQGLLPRGTAKRLLARYQGQRGAHDPHRQKVVPPY